ncbi:hypothetical protein [Enterococcus hirae]|uniref:hypothetical protein n=1 Tax=Enterococcus hirae TaxID=1354 RepID=UPI0032E3A5C6
MEDSLVIYSYKDLKQLSETDFSKGLTVFIQGRELPVDERQRFSWEDCHCFLMTNLETFSIKDDLKFVFEYFCHLKGDVARMSSF